MTLVHAIEERIRDAPLSVHLATSVDDRPHVAPVWYGYRDGTISVLTGGKKLENVRQNPRVGLSIERTDGHGGVEWAVTILGRATVIDDPERMQEARGWIFDAYDDDGSDEGAEEATDDDETDDIETDDVETDGGETDGVETNDVETDGGDDSSDYALLEIAIGSATLQSYE